MKERVVFLLHFPEEKANGGNKEVMDVDLDMWNALKQTLSIKYQDTGILDFMFQEFPIHLKQDEFLTHEGPMRKIKDDDLTEAGYKALFSLDVFVRQLDELGDSDIIFDLA